MQLDELKNTWREEMNAEVTPESFSYNKLVADVKKTDRGALFARNVIVTMTGALIVLFGFIWFLVKPDMNLPQHASMVLMLVLFCYLSSVMTTSLAIGSQDNWTMARRLDIEIENIQNQVSIFKSLPGRFVLPMFLVVILGSYGGYYARTGSLVQIRRD